VFSLFSVIVREHRWSSIRLDWKRDNKSKKDSSSSKCSPWDSHFNQSCLNMSRDQSNSPQYTTANKRKRQSSPCNQPWRRTGRAEVYLYALTVALSSSGCLTPHPNPFYPRNLAVLCHWPLSNLQAFCSHTQFNVLL
jgi:hypothetical protein